MTEKSDLTQDAVLDTFWKVEKRDYQIKCIEEIVNSLNKNRDVALRLPTGTGKSFVFMPIGIASAGAGYRTCILCATNLLMSQMKNRYFPRFKSKVDLVAVKGIEHYDCSITGQKADYFTCTREQREACREAGYSCDVLKYGGELEKHNLIVTNFHKFLSTPIENKFDLVVIDDSHGFENAVDDKFQTLINYFRIEDLYHRHEPRKDKVSDLTGNFLDIFDDIINSMPPAQLTRKVADDDISKIAEIDKYVEKEELQALDTLDRGIIYELLYFIKNCKDITLNTFFVQKDYYNPEDRREVSLISRKSERYIKRVMPSIFANSRVILTSAFLGRISTHAQSCTYRKYDGSQLVTVPKEKLEIVKKWFDSLYIYEVTDLVGGSGDPFDEGVELIAKMLRATAVKSLLLFKNYRNQRRAESGLRREVERDITFIDDSYQTEQVQELVQKADVIMASASSRLWEGIDIRRLRFEIIFSLPFIRPPVYMDRRLSFPYVKRKMLIRLQQGIGRLIRQPGDLGVCVVLNYSKEPTRWSRLESHKNDANFSPDMRERIIRISKNDVCDRVKRTLKEG